MALTCEIIGKVGGQLMNRKELQSNAEILKESGEPTPFRLVRMDNGLSKKVS